MDSLILQNVRCFGELPPIPLGWITLLVGENSTGKSTFLAGTRLAWDLSQKLESPDFNEGPFELGNYAAIAQRHSRTVSPFSIGFARTLRPVVKERIPNLRDSSVRWAAAFTEGGFQPRLKRWSLKAAPFAVELEFGDRDKPPSATFSGPKESRYHYTPEMIMSDFSLFSLFFSLRTHMFQPVFPLAKFRALPSEIKEALRILVDFARPTFPSRPIAFGPIRAEPKRSYDPISESPTPQGDHIPLTLAKLYSENEAQWQKLQQALSGFGEAARLFTSISVKGSRRKSAGPFEISVKWKGTSTNLKDVGYGVSQVLPLLVECIRGRRDSTYLIQQPEVHLHPRAQAALGSLLANLAINDKKRFIIETHSDHLVDRIRMELRDNERLAPEDIKILYFERRRSGEVMIHPLELDEEGNITNAPDGYRDFFLKETYNLLGVK